MMMCMFSACIFKLRCCHIKEITVKQALETRSAEDHLHLGGMILLSWGSDRGKIFKEGTEGEEKSMRPGTLRRQGPDQISFGFCAGRRGWNFHQLCSWMWMPLLWWEDLVSYVLPLPEVPGEFFAVIEVAVCNWPVGSHQTPNNGIMLMWQEGSKISLVTSVLLSFWDVFVLLKEVFREFLLWK